MKWKNMIHWRVLLQEFTISTISPPLRITGRRMGWLEQRYSSSSSSLRSNVKIESDEFPKSCQSPRTLIVENFLAVGLRHPREIGRGPTSIFCYTRGEVPSCGKRPLAQLSLSFQRRVPCQALPFSSRRLHARYRDRGWRASRRHVWREAGSLRLQCHNL